MLANPHYLQGRHISRMLGRRRNAGINAKTPHGNRKGKLGNSGGLVGHGRIAGSHKLAAAQNGSGTHASNGIRGININYQRKAGRMANHMANIIGSLGIRRLISRRTGCMVKVRLRIHLHNGMGRIPLLHATCGRRNAHAKSENHHEGNKSLHPPTVHRPPTPWQPHTANQQKPRPKPGFSK